MQLMAASLLSLLRHDPLARFDGVWRPTAPCRAPAAPEGPPPLVIDIAH